MGDRYDREKVRGSMVSPVGVIAQLWFAPRAHPTLASTQAQEQTDMQVAPDREGHSKEPLPP